MHNVLLRKLLKALSDFIQTAAGKRIGIFQRLKMYKRHSLKRRYIAGGAGFSRIISHIAVLLINSAHNPAHVGHIKTYTEAVLRILRAVYPSPPVFAAGKAGPYAVPEGQIISVNQIAVSPSVASGIIGQTIKRLYNVKSRKLLIPLNMLIRAEINKPIVHPDAIAVQGICDSI